MSYSIPAPVQHCIHQLFELQVERTPNHIAVVFGKQELTYQELNSRANQLAHYLQFLGVRPDRLVGICMNRSLDMVIGLLGILKAGAAYVPLDPAYPQERLAFMIEDSRLSILLTESDRCTQLPPHQAQVICLDTDWPQIAQYSKKNPESEVTPNDLAYTIYTSGSTGKPKGVLVPHRGVTNLLTVMQQTPGLTEHDVFLAVSTISFDIAAVELYLPLTVGAKSLLVSREVASDAAQLVNLLAEAGVTVMQATPATWRLLLAAGWEGDRNLKIICGGEALSRDLANQLLERCASVWNGYGPTEASIYATFHEVEPGEKPVAIGRPIAHTHIYLVDPENRSNLSLVATGEPGELLIGGIGLARGYLNRSDLTAERFISDPFSEHIGGQLYRTSDLARYLPDGTIEYIGRIDHQVKIRGFRIELGEIEAALHLHPAVREAVVVAREDKSGEKALVAYIVPTDELLKIPALRFFLKERLPEYMVPSTFIRLDALPLTPNGKVDRHALPAPDQSQSRLGVQEAFVAPRTILEEQLAHIWAELLNVEQVGVQDDFFELGGHSLLAAQLLFQVRTKFQVELPLENLFATPTVAGLAEAILLRQEAAITAEPMNSISESASIALSELQADAILDPSIYPDAPFIPGKDQPQSIFLTGATGFLGAFLLHELLQQTQANIYCLVRASSLEEGKQKLAANLNRYLLSAGSLHPRIVPVLGDLAQPCLGLSESQFCQLASEIDVIYHNGAFVNLVYPYVALRAANVLGTQEILKLASHVKTKPVHFISTVDVFQSPHYANQPIILEEKDLANGTEPLDGYAQSKWVAEKLVRAAHVRGIPTSIYRPGMISGHSQTGASQANDLVCRLIKGLIQLGCAPKLDVKLNLAPVDYVSQAIVHLSQQPASLGKAFHLVNSHALPFRELVNQIRSLGYSIQWTDYDQWQTQLIEAASSSVDNALSPLLFLLTEWGVNSEMPYLETAALVSHTLDDRHTLTGLTGTEITCPPVDAKLLRAYLTYLGLGQVSSCVR